MKKKVFRRFTAGVLCTAMLACTGPSLYAEADAVRSSVAEFRGDVDGDGSVNLKDANIVLKASLKIINLTEQKEKLADGNADGKLTLLDANYVLKVALKILASEQMKAETKLEKIELVTGEISPSNPTIEKDGVALTANETILEEKTSCSIAEVSGTPDIDDTKMKVYDFKLDEVGEFMGVLQIDIPLEVGADEVACAGYYNETTGEWEPVLFNYNDETDKVSIYTDHLSMYGVYATKKEGTRKASVSFSDMEYGTDVQNAAAAILEAAQMGAYDTECVNIGLSAVSDSLQLGKDVFGGTVGLIGDLKGYDTSVLSGLNDKLGSIGLCFSVCQIAINVYDGKMDEAAYNALKTSISYILDKTASKIGTTAMQASMIAVAIIDYSLTKFANEAMSGRKDIYDAAYRLYYTKHEPGGNYRSSAEWFKLLYPLFAEGKYNETELQNKVDGIVTDYCNDFWTDETTVAYFMDQATERLKFTGGGGLTEAIKTELSGNMRVELYKDVLPNVFAQIAKKINIKSEKELRDAYKDYADFLNTKISFTFTDKTENLDYNGCPVRFAELSDKAEKEYWTGSIGKNGVCSTYFTLYGHLTSGSPTKLNIYKKGDNPDTAEPIKVIDFEVSIPSVNISTSEGIPVTEEGQLSYNYTGKLQFGGYSGRLFNGKGSISITSNKRFKIKNEMHGSDNHWIGISFSNVSKKSPAYVTISASQSADVMVDVFNEAGARIGSATEPVTFTYEWCNNVTEELLATGQNLNYTVESSADKIGLAFYGTDSFKNLRSARIIIGIDVE